MRQVDHKPKGKKSCTCGARFGSPGDLRKHLDVYTERQGIGFAPHSRDVHQKKKPRWT